MPELHAAAGSCLLQVSAVLCNHMVFSVQGLILCIVFLWVFKGRVDLLTQHDVLLECMSAYGRGCGIEALQMWHTLHACMLANDKMLADTTCSVCVVQKQHGKAFLPNAADDMACGLPPGPGI